MTKTSNFEDFLERFFEYLENILLFCLIFIVLVGMFKIQENNRVILQEEQKMEKYAWYMYSERISVDKTIERQLTSKPEVDTEVFKLEVLKLQEDEDLEVSKQDILDLKVTKNYQPTEEERQFAYKVAFAEAGIEDSIGQTLVINTAINNMRKNGFSSLIEEFKVEGRYQSVKSGEVYNCGRVINVSDVPNSVKKAVDVAFDYDYSEEVLKQQAESLGITDSKYWKGGATYFYNPEACSERQNELRENIKVKFKYGNHIFYRYWDKE